MFMRMGYGKQNSGAYLIHVYIFNDECQLCVTFSSVHRELYAYCLMALSAFYDLQIGGYI